MRILRLVYEPFMALMAVALAVSVAAPYVGRVSPLEYGVIAWLDWVAYGVFAVDFAVRLRLTRDRQAFLRKHWIELLALLPLGMWGFFRWYRILRAAVMLRRYSDFFHTVFLRHGFLYIFVFTFGLVFAGAYAVQHVEPRLGNFGDALWWSFVTTTTVGYGDIAPQTVDGRLVAVCLMLLGIGFIGLFTGTVATFFVERMQRGTAPKDRELAHLKARIDELPEMTPGEYQEFRAVLDAVYDFRRHGHGDPGEG